MTSLRHELASLLVGYDVERFRREHDEALHCIDYGVRSLEIAKTSEAPAAFPLRLSAELVSKRLSQFLDSLPVGAVARARERLGVK